jgi:hypothetical protein
MIKQFKKAKKQNNYFKKGKNEVKTEVFQNKTLVKGTKKSLKYPAQKQLNQGKNSSKSRKSKGKSTKVSNKSSVRHRKTPSDPISELNFRNNSYENYYRDFDNDILMFRM